MPWLVNGSASITIVPVFTVMTPWLSTEIFPGPPDAGIVPTVPFCPLTMILGPIVNVKHQPSLQRVIARVAVAEDRLLRCYPKKFSPGKIDDPIPGIGRLVSSASSPSSVNPLVTSKAA